MTYLYPKITSGGCIVFDDYGSQAWPGAKKAVDEFFSDKPENPLYKSTRRYPAWYIIKK
jgi:O-methyltransferase